MSKKVKKIVLATEVPPPSEAILAQIEREKAELAAVPKSPAVIGRALRCHSCGQVVTELFRLQRIGNFERLACAKCLGNKTHPHING